MLRDNFPSHPSQRVFYDKSKQVVYKIFKDQDTKLHNYELMKKLGYFNKKLNLRSIGKQHHLLSYQIFLGSICTQNFVCRELVVSEICILDQIEWTPPTVFAQNGGKRKRLFSQSQHGERWCLGLSLNPETRPEEQSLTEYSR